MADLHNLSLKIVQAMQEQGIVEHTSYIRDIPGQFFVVQIRQGSEFEGRGEKTRSVVVEKEPTV